MLSYAQNISLICYVLNQWYSYLYAIPTDLNEFNE